MRNDTSYNLSWIKLGSIIGILGVFAYMAAAFLSLPDLLTYVLAFSFGPFVAIGAVGLYHFLYVEKRTPSLQIAVYSAIAAGITVLIMLAVQLSINEIMGDIIRNSGNGEFGDLLRDIRKGLNSIHWGLDVAWDILIGAATLLFGLNMLKHPKFGIIIGGIGIILGSLLIIVNLYYFPNPPSSVGVVDVGPFTGVWYLVVFIWMLVYKKWYVENYLD